MWSNTSGSYFKILQGVLPSKGTNMDKQNSTNGVQSSFSNSGPWATFLPVATCVNRSWPLLFKHIGHYSILAVSTFLKESYKWRSMNTIVDVSTFKNVLAKNPMPRHQMGTGIGTLGVLKNLLSFGLKEARMEEETWVTSKKVQQVLEMNWYGSFESIIVPFKGWEWEL